MKTIKLLTWHEDVEKKAAALRGTGLRVDTAPLSSSSGVVGELSRLNPDVLVLDLDRLASKSRDIAVALRGSRSACHIPILFAGGVAEKIERIRSENPDASFVTWPEARKALTRILKRPRLLHTKPQPHKTFTTPLLQKLGIREKMRVAMIGAPEGFDNVLGELPDGMVLAARITPATELALCFVRSSDGLAATVDLLSSRLPKEASVWIVHPKQKNSRRTDFNQNDVRHRGLAVGLVDYKVCSIDDEWSALKFAWRRL
jgi:hypothetical protein